MMPAASVVLVLSGGNALGAYQAGAYEALHGAGIAIDWIVGASTGAINGAIIAGNAPDAALDRLRHYWHPGTGQALDWMTDEARRTLAAQAGLAWGAPGVFRPRRPVEIWDSLFGQSPPNSLYDTAPLARSIAALVDFDRLNRGAIRFTAAAVEMEEGGDALFDTRDRAVGVEHLLASGALIPAFPPVEIDGRLYADAGASANLPLDAVLGDPPRGPVLCLVVDLLPLRAPRPDTLGALAERMQDLIFASQGRRAIAAWQRLYDSRLAAGVPDVASVTLLHLAYGTQAAEVCGKAFDFSPASAAHRWTSGRDDMRALLDRLAQGAIPVGAPGLTVHRFHGQQAL